MWCYFNILILIHIREQKQYLRKRSEIISSRKNMNQSFKQVLPAVSTKFSLFTPTDERKGNSMTCQEKSYTRPHSWSWR